MTLLSSTYILLRLTLNTDDFDVMNCLGPNQMSFRSIKTAMNARKRNSRTVST